MTPEELDSQTVTLNGVTFLHKDIRVVVDLFYSRVQEDALLKIPFASVHDWPEHVRRLTHFWWIKFGGTPYQFTHYNPVPKHYHAGFNETLLQRWLGLFQQTLNECLTAEQADLWTIISNRMGHALSMKNELYGQSLKGSSEEG
ncbi:MAG TPA: group III truncated hemoglobin [Pseudobdellovibrionaceae bacterium]|nr:group III truncated hemoglobin [Pseudobdellovibrionaceae bacterium]